MVVEKPCPERPCPEKPYPLGSRVEGKAVCNEKPCPFSVKEPANLCARKDRSRRRAPLNMHITIPMHRRHRIYAMSNFLGSPPHPSIHPSIHPSNYPTNEHHHTTNPPNASAQLMHKKNLDSMPVCALVCALVCPPVCPPPSARPSACLNHKKKKAPRNNTAKRECLVQE